MADIKSSEYHDEYLAHRNRWQKIRDVLDGEYTLKQRDLSLTVGGNTYLRKINPSDTSQYNKERNEGYVNGARFYNASDRTLQGLMGMLYRSEPLISDLPTNMDYLKGNADGSGLSLEGQSKAVSADVISLGRDGLLVDMPSFDGEATIADMEAGLRPSILEYKSESIVDWHERIVGGVRVLDMVKLLEVGEEYNFANPKMVVKDQVKYYKMLYLDDSGNVMVSRWKDDEVIETAPMIKGDRTPFKVIPFVFVGSKNNSPRVDKAPLESIVDVNIGHYQESANLASSSFQLSAAQPWIADDNYQRAVKNSAIEGGDEVAKMGEGSAFVLGTGGQFAITSPPENTLASSLRDDYKDQMVSLGAQLITDGGQSETAEAARIKHASDVSVLDMVAVNVSMAYTKCLKWCAEFLNVVQDDLSFELNRDFFDVKLTPEQQRELVAAWQSGVISKDVLDKRFVKGGVIPESVDLDEMNGQIETTPPILDNDQPL
jgi:hypothetical protein